MVESPDYRDPVHGIPVFSLYGAVRRPTPAMMDTFDVLLVDLQDLGCRIYTFVTTLRYVLEAAAKAGKAVWVLDRPNPVGRPVEGLTLRAGCESFVGAGALPMRHGLTLGELARWFVTTLGLDVEYRVISMSGGTRRFARHGWPLAGRTWINPSPNAPNLWMARCYPGSVLLEGTTLSEGRGTTRPLELMGAPDFDPQPLLAEMRALAPAWMNGCRLRPCSSNDFPQACRAALRGISGSRRGPGPLRHAAFKPWRLFALAFKALRRLRPDYPIWRDFPYEYENDRLAIDVINGSDLLRRWVDDSQALPGDLEAIAAADEADWRAARAPFLLY